MCTESFEKGKKVGILKVVMFGLRESMRKSKEIDERKDCRGEEEDGSLKLRVLSGFRGRR